MNPTTPTTAIDISQHWRVISHTLINRITECTDIDREGQLLPLLKRGKVEKLPGDYPMRCSMFRYTIPLTNGAPGHLDLQVQVCSNLHLTNKHVSDGLNQALAVTDVSLIIDGLPYNPFIQSIPSDLVLIVGYEFAELMTSFTSPTKAAE